MLLGQTHDSSFKSRVGYNGLILSLAEVALAHGFGEVPIVVHAVHDALVVPKVEDRHGGHQIDSEEEPLLFQMAGHMSRCSLALFGFRHTDDGTMGILGATCDSSAATTRPDQEVRGGRGVEFAPRRQQLRERLGTGDLTI